MQPAIYIENLSKKYQLGLTHARSLNEVAARWSTRFRRMCRTRPSSEVTNEDIASHKTFWALKDINLEIKPGTVVGVIGRNGAGKSTLLKILSRVTKPSTGRVDLRGRVASLLEVGTGFHPELTGRENVYMNGTLLGMTKREVDRRFTEIVDFAGVEQFIDTPVKRYSSGMKVRLGFAVAAHLEPEILIVDEVLAVGDAAFQERCFGAMENVTASGRTVILVSHQMASVKRLCTTAVLLDDGRISLTTDNIGEAVERYCGSHGTAISTRWDRDLNSPSGPSERPYFTPIHFSLRNSDGQLLECLADNTTEAWVHLEGHVDRPDPNLSLGYALSRRGGPLLFWSYIGDGERPVRISGRFCIRSRIPTGLLNSGRYQVELVAGLHCQEWFYRPGNSSIALQLDVHASAHTDRAWFPVRPTPLAPILQWEVVSGSVL